MLTLKNLVQVVVVGAVMVTVVVISGGEASARPKYAAVANTTYPELAKKVGTDGKLTCAMCHPTSSKKERNNYGAAVGMHLSKKNETDEAKIKETLTKAEAEASKTEGKTFGDLIKDGVLPGTTDVAK